MRELRLAISLAAVCCCALPCTAAVTATNSGDTALFDTHEVTLTAPATGLHKRVTCSRSRLRRSVARGFGRSSPQRFEAFEQDVRQPPRLLAGRVV